MKPRRILVRGITHAKDTLKPDLASSRLKDSLCGIQISFVHLANVLRQIFNSESNAIPYAHA